MQKKSIIIADLQSHSIGGHFATWFNRTIEEATRSFENITVYVADKFSYPSQNIIERLGNRLAIFEIEPIRISRKWHGDILGVIQEHHASCGRGSRSTPVFIMWGQQFLDRNILYPYLKNRFFWKNKSRFIGNWGTLFSAGSLAYEGSETHEIEAKVHHITIEDNRCKGVFLWDSYAVNSLQGKYMYLPDVEDVSSDDKWKLPTHNMIVIGSVGQLWGYRSVNLITEILSENEVISGYLGGVLKYESYSESAKKLIDGNSRQICIENGFVETNKELNDRLKKIDAFVIDSRTYKYPSGLAIRAMAMGRPIVTLDYPSWASNLIRDHGVGVFWQPGSKNLSNQLECWFKSGGANRSLKLASKLNDRDGMHKAYDEMFDRLKKSR